MPLISTLLQHFPACKCKQRSVHVEIKNDLENSGEKLTGAIVLPSTICVYHNSLIVKRGYSTVIGYSGSTTPLKVYKGLIAEHCSKHHTASSGLNSSHIASWCQVAIWEETLTFPDIHMMEKNTFYSCNTSEAITNIITDTDF